jgi:hypothetical protein
VLGLIGCAIGVAGLTGDGWWAAVTGGGLMVIAMRLAWALRRPRHRYSQDVPREVPLTPSAREPHWSSFEAELDWVGRKQARRAREAIQGFLAERDSESLTHEHRALLLSCERRVPELLNAVGERCRNATRHERLRYIDDTLNRLVQIGTEAEQARREIREADDRHLQTLHRYFDGVTQGSDDRPSLP